MTTTNTDKSNLVKNHTWPGPLSMTVNEKGVTIPPYFVGGVGITKKFDSNGIIIKKNSAGGKIVWDIFGKSVDDKEILVHTVVHNKIFSNTYKLHNNFSLERVN